MKKKIQQTFGVSNVGELKRLIVANAVATGNSFAFHDLFSQLKEFADTDNESAVTPAVLNRLAYLLPTRDTTESPKFRRATEIVGEYSLNDDVVPATLLEETAKEAVSRGKFAYAEDAYRLLGIKKEIVALYAQTGEQLLRDDKPKQGAVAFLVAASLDQPLGPHYQDLGPELHSACQREPDKCVTALPIDSLMDEAIKFLISNDDLAQRLLSTAKAAHKPHIIETLAAARDTNLHEFMENLRKGAVELSKIGDGQPDDYSPIGPALLGRIAPTGQAWEYLKELSFEHPIAALCVCLKLIRQTPVLVPVLRDGKPLLELLLPAEFQKE